MTAWLLLMGICLSAPIAVGWVASNEAGIAGALPGMLVGFITGLSGVVAMWFSYKAFERWLEVRKPGIRVQLLMEGSMNLAGLAWCMAVALGARFLVTLAN